MHKTSLAYSLQALLLTSVLGAAWAVDGEEKLIGWQGETFEPKEFKHSDGRDISKERVRPWIQTISWKPRAQVYHHFLSDSEARHIIELSRYQMKRSSVVGGPNNTGVVSSIRTSAGCFLRRNLDPVITAVDARLALWSQLPPENQEDMQVLRYGPTNKYGPHLDGLQRVMSVLIYLVEPEEGGETAFVNSQWAHPELAKAAGDLSACAAGHVAYKPKRGDALLFYDVTANYLNPDGSSMHTGCPVVKGVKWNAVKWIHGIPFQESAYKESLAKPPTLPPDPGMCTDDHANCKMWADGGECEKNPGYMMGKTGGNGACRKACNDCEPCEAGDKACMDRNRVRGGYVLFDEAEFGF